MSESMIEKPEDKVIISLDLPQLSEATGILKGLRGLASFVKVGPCLFIRNGKKVIKVFKDMGLKVFLDLKFHDIPSIVSKAAIEALELGVDMMDFHIMGGRKMIKAVVEELKQSRKKNIPKLIGVTILTSMDESSIKEELFIQKTIPEVVLSLAKLAKQSGLDGVVVSPKEVYLIKKELGENFLTVVPGIKPSDMRGRTDQMRTSTPHSAIKNGADYIVIGRAILEKKDKKGTLLKIIEEVKEGMESRHSELY